MEELYDKKFENLSIIIEIVLKFECVIIVNYEINKHVRILRQQSMY